MSPTDARPIEPVRRLRLADAVAAELEQMIVRGDYEVGERLPPERVLAEQFGVGRSSMREALKVVEADGLLTINHGVGVFVASDTKRPRAAAGDLRVIDDATVPELFEVRRALEAEAAALAASRITAREAQELAEIVARAADPAVSDEEFLSLDTRMHTAIFAATKNRILLQIYEVYRPLFLTYSERVLQLPEGRDRAQSAHEEIVVAIAGRRRRDARNATVKHLRDVEASVVEHLARAGRPVGDEAAPSVG
jgi:GntR family transcriptional repressor for pyruvate dehydrogenase complex